MSPTALVNGSGGLVGSEAVRGLVAGSRRRDAIRRLMLAGADAVAVVTTVVCVSLIGDHGVGPSVLLLVPAVLVVAKASGLYDRDELLLTRRTLDEVPRVFQVATLLTLLIRLAGHPSNGRLLAIWAGLISTMIVARAVARAVADRLSAPERCLVLGSEIVGAGIERRLLAGGDGRARIVGVVPIDGAAGSRPVLESRLDAVRRAISRPDVDRVLVASATLEPELTVEIVRLARATGVSLTVAPPLPDLVGASVTPDELRGLPILGVRRLGPSRTSRLVKRTVDAAGATIGLLLAAPLLLVAALALKRDSPGGVLFRQTRVGCGGVPFEMLKLRTMTSGSDARRAEFAALVDGNGLFKLANDPRVTSFGRFLRRTSLDELPQLWNVVRGDMSLVGPRPLVLDEDDRLVGWQRCRLDLRPGITGDWQLLGRTRVTLEEMAQIDYRYIANWSLWLDVKILCRTVPHVVRARGL
jgi:exopolysaccharide biosynthesis polyprenyl glycosylphosphotransferase